jgi:uncharacterized membrane protein
VTVSEHRETLRGIGRAFGGALLFVVPIFLTMEVWSLAVSVERPRMVLLVLTTVVLVVALSRYFGMLRRSRVRWWDAVVDAGVALPASIGASFRPGPAG